MWASSALRSNALLGMHPTLRQTPPQYFSSTIAVVRPSCAARIAATYPPGPAPKTTTSNSAVMPDRLWGRPNSGRAVTLYPRAVTSYPRAVTSYPRAVTFLAQGATIAAAGGEKARLGAWGAVTRRWPTACVRRSEPRAPHDPSV